MYIRMTEMYIRMAKYIYQDGKVCIKLAEYIKNCKIVGQEY